MRNLTALLFFIATTSLTAQNSEINDEQEAKIKNIITLFKNKDIEGICQTVEYPLYRDYPLQTIINKQNLKERFEKIFDISLIKRISESDVKDWSEVGWRGIMLDNGLLWINDEGKITGLNYQSDSEKIDRANLILEDKLQIHQSLRDYFEPALLFKTKHHLIRIDLMHDKSYRYVSWKNNQSQFSKPEIILLGGTVEYSGTGGNHSYSFVNGSYTYMIYRFVLRSKCASEFKLSVRNFNNTIYSDYSSIK